MSIQSEINRIAGAKSDIADAIEDQGVTVPSGTKLDGMANLIGQISGGSEKLNSTQAADAYDPTATYAVGDKVSYAGNVYSCISAISTPEAWDSTHWDRVDPIQDQVDDVRNTLNQLDQDMAYVENGNTASRTYSAGVYISWKGTLYTASTAIPLGDPFAVGTNLADVSGGGLNSLNDKIGNLDNLLPPTRTDLVSAINYNLVSWYQKHAHLGGKISMQLQTNNDDQWFLIFGSLYTSSRIAYLAYKSSGSWYLSNLGGNGTITASGSTVTFSETYADVAIISNQDFTVVT